MERLVLKIGGSELENILPASGDDFVAGLIEAVRTLQREAAVVLVHGGGKTIAGLQARLGLEARFVDGLRVTDDASLDVAEMVLSGLTNKRLTARFVSAGVRAVGLSGVDDGLIRVRRLSQPGKDWGWVGEVVAVNPDLLETLLAQGTVPILSPISLGLDGHSYNVNADHAAAALAVALNARELVLISDVPGVLTGAEKACLPMLSPDQVEALIATGEISGGMIPKVRSALTALERGVERARIVNLAGLVNGGGTCFVRRQDGVY
mgnify:CR=1 FL=1